MVIAGDGDWRRSDIRRNILNILGRRSEGLLTLRPDLDQVLEDLELLHDRGLRLWVAIFSQHLTFDEPDHDLCFFICFPSQPWLISCFFMIIPLKQVHLQVQVV